MNNPLVFTGKVALVTEAARQPYHDIKVGPSETDALLDGGTGGRFQ